MYCPKCGKRQISDGVRFCAKCGLALEPARKSLIGGSAVLAESGKVKGLSPRAKGILQGIAIVPCGIGAMAVIDIFYESLGAGMMAGLYSTLTMVVLVAVMRILYALFYESGPAAHKTAPASPLNSQNEVTATENQPALSAATGEMVLPHSVTEHTTRQLDPNR
ncbi:MAG: zinc ribbon domain-containing protein [Pyrinomonadaceae bacterium]